MFYYLSKILDLGLSPLTWTLVLLALGIPWRRRMRWRRRQRLSLLLAFFVLLFFSLEPVSARLRWRLEADVRPATLPPGETYDAIILLGGVVDERPAEQWHAFAFNENSERLLATFDLLREGRAAAVIITSAPTPGIAEEARESPVLGAQLERWGIPRERIVLEERARNTRENAVFSAEIARARGWSRLLLVTSAFHMPRALGCFRKVGLPVTPFAADYKAYDPARYPLSWEPRSKHFEHSASALREFSGIWIYRLRGYSE